MTNQGTFLRVTTILVGSLCLTVAGIRDGSSAPTDVSAAARANYSIAGIRALPYFQETGHFGQNDLTKGTQALWNLPIGGSDGTTPTAAILVLVDLSGPGFGSAVQGTLDVQARAGNQSILNTRQRLNSFFSEKDRISIPFILYGTGCSPIEISASLLAGSKNRDVKKASIPFRCGE